MILVLLVSACLASLAVGDECHLTPVIHVLQYPGCIPKPIPSFACTGRCTSYVQVSGSKIWQTERSCMCCQESGEREANVALFCPKAAYDQPKVRKVSRSFSNQPCITPFTISVDNQSSCRLHVPPMYCC